MNLEELNLRELLLLRDFAQEEIGERTNRGVIDLMGCPELSKLASQGKFDLLREKL